MKKILSLIAAFFVLFLSAGSAFSKEAKDVAPNYWAAKEISAVLTNGYLDVDKAGKFNPEATVTRAEFTSALLKTLGHKATPAKANKFKDLCPSHVAYNDIIMAEGIGLVYGYPDKTFRADNTITKTETASVISHITKDIAADVAVLKSYKDGSDVPAWGTKQYAKTIKMGIFVNYPDAKALTPNKVLNRAEEAVLLYKLANALSFVKEKYVAADTLVAVEHLDVCDKAPSNEVKIMRKTNIVAACNVLAGYFVSDFSSKTALVGDCVSLVAKENVYTKEGTLVIPQGTKFYGTVATLEHQKIWNQNAEVTLDINKVTFPSGCTVPCSAKVFNNKDGVLTASGWATTGKVLAYTAGGAAVGTGAGVGFAAIPSPKKYGTGVAIGLPVGAGVGLITGFVTPGLAYTAQEGDLLYLILNSAVTLPKN